MTLSPKNHTQNLAGRCPTAIMRLLVIAAALLAADLLIKHFAFKHVPDQPIELVHETGDVRNRIPAHDAVVVIPSVLDLKLTLNRGAVFGIGQGGRWIFIAATAIALIIISVIFARSDRRAWVFHAALACILAGALGNLFDRLLFGAVRDMFWLFPGVKLPFGWQWPGGSDDVYPWIFNFADASLLTGVAIMFLSAMRAPKHENPSNTPGETPDDDHRDN